MGSLIDPMTTWSSVDRVNDSHNVLSTSVDNQATATHRSGHESLNSERGGLQEHDERRDPENRSYANPQDAPKQPSRFFGVGGKFRPFRLLKQDLVNLRQRYMSDWQIFNQQIVASAVYIFFTNILPGITFASDLYTLTGKSWGTIEVVFSTGLCGLIFSLLVCSGFCHLFSFPFLDRTDLNRFSGQPLTILGVTGPFSVLAENIYELCETHFHASSNTLCQR